MIRVNKASKFYGAKCALNIENFSIPDGQMVGLIGANGAGKTTLLRAIAGLLNLDLDMQIDDVHSDIEMREKVIFITEEFSFFPGMPLKDHADFYSDYYVNFDRERYFKLLDFFELPVNRKPKNLSRGQKAKLEIAIGFSKGGKYLLLDEPFLGNDVFTRRNFLRLMGESLKKDETIIIATHLLDEIENFIDRAVFLYRGEIKNDVFIDDLRTKGSNLEEILKETLSYDDDRFKNMFL